uniref:Transposon Ty3-I Gag-Pol polyprotein n=2 Tax=Noccaea caerulescens TaxID=107243 RepID=A0A1J3IVR9_NOCCA
MTVETRAQALAEQVEEMRNLQEQTADEQKKRTEALEETVKRIESMMVTHLTREQSKQPQVHQESSSTSTAPPITPGLHQFPEPPDLSKYEQIQSGKIVSIAEKDKSSILPNGMAARLTKIGFPIFDGSRVRDWIFRCEQFFDLDSTPAELKVRLASIHLEGKALLWHHHYMANRFGISPSWTDYAVAASARFGELYDDPLSELVGLKQDNDSVEVYLEKFEGALTRLALPEAHALSIFLTNMNPHLALDTRKFGVQTVTAAAKIAKLHESSLLHTPTKQTRVPFHPSQKSYHHSPYKNPNTSPILPLPENTKSQSHKPNFIPRSINEKSAKKYSYSEMQDRRNNGLCMFCDEPFTPGHHLKHKRTQVFIMDGEIEEHHEDEDDDSDAQLEEEISTEVVEKSPVISVNALSGSATFNCMRVVGQYAKRKLHILIDPGSTHNFLDLSIAKELGCSLEKIKPMAVAAANGSNMVTGFKCRNFTWKLQGYTLSTEVRTLPLDCCDFVLGVQWLSTLGPILWDFSNLRMEFNLAGVKHVLRGVTKSGCMLIKGSSLNKLMLQEPQIALLQVHEITDSNSILEPEALLSHISTSESALSDDPHLKSLLEDFNDLFEEPEGLPPFREGFDHTIPLEVGANPVNLRPYRYSSLQKDVVDKMIQDMLSQGIIQCSSSPYASPIVLVKKKDGTWRLCVDYRGLNKQTVKDKYPIPLLEDLLDELGGSKYFSKLDLRAGFHQLRMSPEDIYKTAFKTHAGHYEYLVMPFGLTNAPCTFQGLMNHVFQAVTRKFLLVFFDDILVYSKSWEEHLKHLEEVFSILRHQQLYLKPSKCTFGATVIEYLGHFISAEGVSTDPKKVKAIEEWPIPVTQKQLRSFLGLANYYRRFIKGYSVIAKPLSTLLKKEGFTWNPEADSAFQKLKLSLTTTPVLALPNFEKVFVVETDASNIGIGAVLMQDSHPICFISRALGPRHQALSVYEKELMAVVHAVQTWNAYLAHRPFVIKTDQKSLKFLMEQKVTTPFQHMWLSKLMGYTFEIQYKQGKENHAADALSRVTGSELLHITLSHGHHELYDSIRLLWQRDPHLHNVISDLQVAGSSHPTFTFVNEELRRRGKLVIGNDPEVKLQIFKWLHDSAIGGHSGRDATLHRVKSLFYWPKMSLEVQNYVRNCSVCQRNKYDLSAKPGLLQPLPVPKGVWESISMDFIEGLPPSLGKHCILVVIDRLSKNAHFLALSHPYTALDVARVYMDQVFKLHGMPHDIVSDRDPVFLSEVWKEMFRVHGVDLRFSTAYHPQSDGQTEITNKTLETYLRCMISDVPHTWSSWLPLAEWWYNTTFHSAIQSTPFEIVYGQPPSLHLPYLPGESSSVAVDRSLKKREEIIAMLKFHLLRAQNRMKQSADSHRSQREFKVGDYVYLKLQPYRQHSLKNRKVPNKLSPRFYGPFCVIDKVGIVAYKLDLPSGTAIHNVFHVSQLKLCPNPPTTTPTLPQYLVDVGNAKEPELILETKMVQRQNKAVTKVLVQWKGEPPEKATWEFYQDFISKYPTFHP